MAKSKEVMTKEIQALSKKLGLENPELAGDSDGLAEQLKSLKKLESVFDKKAKVEELKEKVNAPDVEVAEDEEGLDSQIKQLTLLLPPPPEPSSKKKKSSGYVVAEKKVLSTKNGMKEAGDAISENDVNGGKPVFEKLISREAVVKK